MIRQTRPDQPVTVLTLPAGDHAPALCTDDLEEVPGVWAGPASSRAVHHLCGGGGA
jgi:hypothetical protein